MKRSSRGFGLVEIMVALVLGLIVSLGIIQIFTASRATFTSQNAAARMQEDARFVLSKMIQEIRMTGMVGCLGSGSYPLVAAPPELVRSLTPAVDPERSILWDNTARTLTLVTADIGTAGTTPNWTILSDCQTSSRLFLGARAPAAGQTAFPLRQLIYGVNGGTLTLRAGAGAPIQTLLQNVSALDIQFGMAGSPMTYTNAVTLVTSVDVRSVRLTLTLADPSGQVREQRYSAVAYLRNRF
ncbi:prepilin-type N-terminal cleavage/methylation domain-containing protein [Pseudomonas sp. R1-18]|uniref:PilW family protein n=1 Tax=Pseudomonas sp. R1-18 TaxID=1632772 RepID=UPI003DA82C31